jgi:SAM-dependent methyltransferase
VDDRVIWTVLTEPRACNLRRLEAAVRLLPDKSPTFVEFGSGTGRNLLHLQRLFPASRCIGLELSPVSVELARSLAARFQLNVEFHACDVTQSVPLEAHSASLVFSCHALEQMPRLFPAVIARMCDTSSSVVLMLEPIPTLWPWNTRGIASRLRVRALDRLRGVMPALRRVVSSGEWEILMRERLRSGSNPLNETCEVLLRRRINPV